MCPAIVASRHCGVNRPPSPMSLKPKFSHTATLLFMAAFSFGKPAAAQIGSYVDAGGKLIYTNDGSSEASGNGSGAVEMRQGKGAKSPLEQIRALLGSHTKSGPAVAQPVNPELDQMVQDAAERHDLDPELVKAVISTESGWNSRAISDKGAMGLMQLIPSTAQRFGVGNPFDPAQNIEGGTSYLKTLLDRYNGDLSKSLAAYNAGERAVDQSGGIPAYPETQRYVQKVTKAYFRPGSSHTSTQWIPPKPPVRRELEAGGRVVFTNE